MALVCPYSLSVPGGVQGQVLGLARHLRRIGVEARIVAPGGGGNGRGLKAHDLEEMYALDSGTIDLIGRSIGIRANGSIAQVDASPASWLDAARRIGRGGYDLLHIHEPFAPGAAYACLVLCNVPKVATFHRAGGSPLYRLLAPLARYAMSRVDRVCAVSDEAAYTACSALGDRYLPGDHARAITVLWNGVDIERYQRIDDGGEKSRERVVIFVGRHEERKGLGVLLEAFRMLRVRYLAGEMGQAPLELWVFGEGPQSAKLKAEYGGDPGVSWFGRVDDMELARRMKRADIFCAPSLGGESFGVVLLEAMAASTLVVASDIAGYRTVVGEHGILVPPGDPDSLAGGLEMAFIAVAGALSPASPQNIESARRHAAGYSMEQLAARYAEIYSEVVSNAAS